MTNDYSFLTQLITEDIYVVNEDKDSEPSERAVLETPPSPAPLIATEDNTVSEPEEVYVQPLPTEGNNLKHCLVFVESSEEILEDSSKEFLANILKAVKRSLEDILLVNLKDASTDQLEALLAEQNHRHVISFGTEKLNELNPEDKYTVHQANHKYYLNADALNLISTEKDKKKALWTALQEMFL